MTSKASAVNQASKPSPMKPKTLSMAKKDPSEDVMNYSNVSILDNYSSPRSPLQNQLKRLMPPQCVITQKAFV